MTSRLKHKLDLEQINLKSAYLNESFVQIGTPLPALAETRKDKLEYVPEWQQEVRDEKGRRRFHGAFTGGFSAGYFNSVGSKEGWAPSEFKSSRNNRAAKTQRPEDFMDEEDLAQMNDDRKLVNTETFQSAPQTQFAGLRDESMPSALESLITPAKSSIGETLLMKLGWRKGQGIGPRVTLRKLRIQEGKLGRIRNGLGGHDEEDDESMGERGNGESSKHTYAPRDTKLLTYAAKEDKEGLGYEKGSGMGKLPGKMPVGTRRLDDDEDDDPYNAMSESSSARQYAFDGMDDNDDIIVMGEASQLPSHSTAERRGASGTSGDGDRWHDGRPVLPGFVLDPLGVPTEKWFAIPDIPPDWRPRPARVWGTTRKLEEAPVVKEEKEVIRGAPNRPLTFEQRGEALGEEQRISKAKSVFEYMSEKDRERLSALAAAARGVKPPPLSMEAPLEDETPVIPPRPTEVEVPPLSPRTAGAALRGFIPYGDDLPKQDRYKSYLESQTHNTRQPEPVLKKGTIDEINKELNEFFSSARIFKPMSYAMSNRFTSGSSSLAASDLKQAKPGLHMYDAAKVAEAQEAAANKPPDTSMNRNLSAREKAAKDGMYGPLTRTIKEFYPVKLVCKRFGVLDPHPEGEPKGVQMEIGGVKLDPLETMPLPKNDASWQDAFIHQGDIPTEFGVSKAKSLQAEETAGKIEVNSGGDGEEHVPRNITEVGMAEDVNQGRDTLTYTKPSIDIFKAIFASDDEDEDGDPIASAKTAGNTANPSRNGTSSNNWLKGSLRTAPADLSTFKPVFSARKNNEATKVSASIISEEHIIAKFSVDRASENGSTKDGEKKEKKRKKAKRSGVLSFDTGEDAPEDDDAERERRKKKRDGLEKGGLSRISDGKVEDVQPKEEDGEWVEKPAVAPRLAGRKGAADFM